MNSKNIVIAIIAIAVVGLGIYLLSNPSTQTVPAAPETATTTATVATTTPVQNTAPQESIGKSVQGRDIMAYHFGTGTDEILFVGGIHGSYEWNTGAVAFDLIDYLKKNPVAIPANIKVTVIPVLNPDGMSIGTGKPIIRSFSEINDTPQEVLVSGRFNANKVDLNRNFDCDWKANGIWQNKTVSGGTSAFSEPESLAMKNYVATHNLSAAVVWYSAAGGVYSSSCGGTILPETSSLTSTFAAASGYPAFDKYDPYALTGDMVNWFAKMNIPAISVLLTNHTDTEWTKNLAGVQAVLKSFAK